MAQVVKVGVAGSRVVEVALAGNETYAEAFKAAELEVPEGYVVTGNGRRKQLTDRVSGGTKLVLAAPRSVSGGR